MLFANIQIKMLKIDLLDVNLHSMSPLLKKKFLIYFKLCKYEGWEKDQFQSLWNSNSLIYIISCWILFCSEQLNLDNVYRQMKFWPSVKAQVSSGEDHVQLLETVSLEISQRFKAIVPWTHFKYKLGHAQLFRPVLSGDSWPLQGHYLPQEGHQAHVDCLQVFLQHFPLRTILVLPFYKLSHLPTSNNSFVCSFHSAYT